MSAERRRAEDCIEEISKHDSRAGACFADMDHRLQRVEDEVGEIKTDLKGVKTEVHTLHEQGCIRRDDHEEDIRGLRLEIADVRSDSKKTNEHLGEIASQVERIQATLTTGIAMFRTTVAVAGFFMALALSLLTYWWKSGVEPLIKHEIVEVRRLSQPAQDNILKNIPK